MLRFDTAEFPHTMCVTGRLAADGWSGTLRAGQRRVSLRAVGGIYFRRPTTFQFGTMPESEAEWAHAEARSGLGGLLMAQDRWLNHPHRIGYAEYKPVQLAAAARAGLTVPQTLITNDVAEAHAFAAQLGQVIYKPLSPASPPGPGDSSMLYTSVVEPQHLAKDGEAIAVTMRALLRPRARLLRQPHRPRPPPPQPRPPARSTRLHGHPPTCRLTSQHQHHPRLRTAPPGAAARPVTVLFSDQLVLPVTILTCG